MVRIGHEQKPVTSIQQRPTLEHSLGATLEKTLARALSTSTLSVGGVFLCICSTAHSVGTSLRTHGYAVVFLNPSCGLAFDVGTMKSGVTVVGFLAPGRVLGSPLVNSVLRNSQVLHTG